MNPHRRAASTRTEGEYLTHASSEKAALKPAASQNPLSASEPWNLVADGYAETTMLVFEQFADEAIAASKLKPNSTVLNRAQPCSMSPAGRAPWRCGSRTMQRKCTASTSPNPCSPCSATRSNKPDTATSPCTAATRKPCPMPTQPSTPPSPCSASCSSLAGSWPSPSAAPLNSGTT